MRVLPDKTCVACGQSFNRRRYNGRLEDAGVYSRRRYCSQSCANTREELTLDGYRARARKLRGPVCEECGTSSNLHAHHRNGDVTDNRPENIETLCVSCHIGGHWARKRVA